MISTLPQFYDIKGKMGILKVPSPSISGAEMGKNHIFSGIYTPSGEHKDLPLVLVLAPWLSGGLEMMNWRAFKESFPERIDRLIEKKVIPPAVAVFPQMFTPFGGSQYINSSYFGGHGDFLAKDLLSHIRHNVSEVSDASKIYALGRSSGGFGALRLAMDYPGLLDGCACHSGDTAFDISMRKDLTSLSDVLMQFDGKIEKFTKAVWSRKKRVPGHWLEAMMVLGLSGFYSPNREAELGFDIPIDLKTGKLKEDVWSKWLDHDPVVRAQKNISNLKQTNKIFVECGTRDQYSLLYGARQLHDVLVGVPHRYEEFNDTHSGTDYRFDVSLPYLLG